jgi:peptidoglycan hydrolase FlgJ
MSLNVTPLKSVEIPLSAAVTSKPPAAASDNPQLRKAFDDFVGETLFGQMLKSMRKTVGKPAYFHGGRTEEVFTQQLDQVLAEKLSAASADKLSGPMYELFMLGRK